MGMQTERTRGESFSKQSEKVFSLDLSNDTFTQSACLPSLSPSLSVYSSLSVSPRKACIIIMKCSPLSIHHTPRCTSCICCKYFGTNQVQPQLENLLQAAHRPERVRQRECEEEGGRVSNWQQAA